MTPKQRLALIVFNEYKCQICRRLGRAASLPPEELEIHRIRAGYEGGTYEDHRNLLVLCKNHHDILSSALRKSMRITS